MQYQVSQLVNDVRVILDKNNVSPSLLQGGADALSVDEIITSRIEPAAVYIATRAPLLMFNNALPLTTNPTIVNGVGTITLPSDFLRLQDISMNSWEGAETVIDESSPLYAQQKSRYAGVRGNKQAPVVALVRHGGTWQLELYTCTTGDTIRYGSYIAWPVISNNNIDLSTKLKDAVEYYAAYLTCLSMGDTDTAGRFLAPAMALAGIQVAAPQQSEPTEE